MLTITSALHRVVAQAGDRPAVLEAGRIRNWHEVVGRIATAAGVLHELGLRRGDVFAIVSRNSAHCFELMHAGYWLGAIPLPVNVRLAPAEIAAILTHAGCRLVAIESAFAGLFAHPSLSVHGMRLLGLDPSMTASDGTYEERLAGARPLAPVDADETDVALLLYTGGTTGTGKGVPLTHRNIVANALQVTSGLRFTSDDVYLHVAPMFHSADLLATGVTMHGGAHAFLPQFGPRPFVEAVERHRVTRTMLAPAMVIAVLDAPELDGADLSSLRHLIYGSSPMPAELIARTLERFAGVDLAQGYGLTETSPLLTLLDMRSHVRGLREGAPHLLRSAGKALPGVDLVVGGPDPTPGPVGQPGEVWVRGPNVVAGYLNAPRETAEAFDAGWFRTGDIGVLDREGYLTLLDRSKDMVVTGGENVYSIEVENVLHRHPSIQEAAVIGVPDARYGEALLAVVVCRPGMLLEPDEMIAHCRAHLGGYKIPRRLAILPELPRSALGKVLKVELRRRFG